jgi:hypothetical protein
LWVAFRQLPTQREHQLNSSFMPSFGKLAFCAVPLLASTTAPNSLVVPGRSLGNITLGASTTTLAALGPASRSDAAMQKAWSTWLGSRPATGSAPTQLDVYTAPAGNDVDHHTVQIVRATSTWFHLANGLRPGARLSAIQQAYGKLPLATTYRVASHPRYLYDNVKRGVAFETDGTASSSRCQAVLIHLPGKAIAQGALPLAAYLQEQR